MESITHIKAGKLNQFMLKTRKKVFMELNFESRYSTFWDDCDERTTVHEKLRLRLGSHLLHHEYILESHQSHYTPVICCLCWMRFSKSW